MISHELRSFDVSVSVILDGIYKIEICCGRFFALPLSWSWIRPLSPGFVSVGVATRTSSSMWMW